MNLEQYNYVPQISNQTRQNLNQLQYEYIPQLAQQAKQKATELQSKIKTTLTSDTAKQWYLSTMENIYSIINILKFGRLFITLFIITWVVLICVYLFQPESTEEQKEYRSSKADRLYYLHRIFFGDDSIIMILFRLWYFILILYALTPLVGEIIYFLKIKSSL